MLSTTFAPLFARLRTHEEVDGLLVAAAAAAPRACGAEHGLIALVEEGRVGRLLAASAPLPAPLAAGLMHVDLAVPRTGLSCGAAPIATRLSPVAIDLLGPGHAAAAWIATEADPHALLVVYGAGAPLDQALVDDAAQTVAIAFDRVVLRRRSKLFADEVQRFGNLARSMPDELMDPVVELPFHHRHAPPANLRSAVGARLVNLSPGERRVAELMAEGHPNPRIAEFLQISPDTVKTQVARVRRKLGARNRVEAISLLLTHP